MYYSKEQLEEMRKKGEKDLREISEGSQEECARYQSQPDIQITCLHCKHDLFVEGKALLNTRGLTFFGLDWLNESATTLLCSQCGFIHWFMKDVKKF